MKCLVLKVELRTFLNFDFWLMPYLSWFSLEVANNQLLVPSFWGRLDPWIVDSHLLRISQACRLIEISCTFQLSSEFLIRFTLWAFINSFLQLAYLTVQIQIRFFKVSSKVQITSNITLDVLCPPLTFLQALLASIFLLPLFVFSFFP